MGPLANGALDRAQVRVKPNCNRRTAYAEGVRNRKRRVHMRKAEGKSR